MWNELDTRLADILSTPKRTPNPTNVIKNEVDKTGQVKYNSLKVLKKKLETTYRFHINAYKRQNVFDMWIIETLHYPSAYPFLIYCKHVCGNVCPTNIQILIHLHDKINRNIYGDIWRTLISVDINKHMNSNVMYQRHGMFLISDLFCDYFKSIILLSN